MRLGVVGLIPSDFFQTDDALAQHIRAMGFSGVGAHVSGNPFNAPEAARHHLRSVLDAHALRLVQFWGWYPSIVTDDESVRIEGVRQACEIIRQGAQIGAEMIGIRPTSMSPNGPWSPDRNNYLPATEDRLVKSLTEIAKAAEAHGVIAALECHVTTTLHSPQAVRRVLERVDSPWLKVNMDPINFIRDHVTAYDTTTLIHQLFEIFEPYIAAAHVKDVLVEDDHVVHIRETPPGDPAGLLDFEAFFRCFEAVMPDGYMLIEHLQPAQVPAAAAFVQQKLAEYGIKVI